MLVQENKPAVVYDGQCPFCIEQVERLKKRDPENQFEWIPREQPGLEKRFPVLATSDFNTGMRFIGTDGNASVGADAVYEICKRLPLFRSIAWLYRLPVFKQIIRLAYAWIAANRMKLGQACSTGTCHTGTEQEEM